MTGHREDDDVRGAYLAVLASCVAPAILAQEPEGQQQTPERFLFMSGYGTVGFAATAAAGQTASSFSVGFNPIFHFQVTDEVHFAGELELALEDNTTVTSLEYAEIDLLAVENLTLRGGKFLLPIGDYIERLHATWINRFPSSPPIFGHDGGPEGFEPLLPIAADIGVQAAYAFPMAGGRGASVAAFVSQGPQDMKPDGEPMLLSFGNSADDNNANKMVGGRASLRVLPALELIISGATAKYDSLDQLDFQVVDATASFRRGPLTLRGELLRTRRDVRDSLTSLVDAERRWGFYAQGSLRLRAWEPVLRGAVLSTDGLPDDGRTQVGVGLNYWLNSSTAVMAGFEVNGERGAAIANNRFLIHWSFGF
jgi:hypothetical protein